MPSTPEAAIFLVCWERKSLLAFAGVFLTFSYSVSTSANYQTKQRELTKQIFIINITFLIHKGWETKGACTTEVTLLITLVVDVPIKLSNNWSDVDNILMPYHTI